MPPKYFKIFFYSAKRTHVYTSYKNKYILYKYEEVMYLINNSHKHHKLKLYKIFKTHTNTKAPFWHGIENTIHIRFIQFQNSWNSFLLKILVFVSLFTTSYYSAVNRKLQLLVYNMMQHIARAYIYTPVTSPNCFKETAKKQVYFLNICYLIAFLAYFTIPYFNTKY